MDLFKNKKIIYIVVSICVILICVVSYLIFENNSHKDEQVNVQIEEYEKEEKSMESEDKDCENIIVHIAGEVNNPGIVELREGSRIKDVIEAAGGVTSDADMNRVNLAYEVKDEQKIIIPNKNSQGDIEVIDENQDFIEEGDKSNILVNINTATQSELESLTGIGPSMASKIISYRNQNGKFKSKEDIKNVPGIGNSKYENIKEEITIK